VQGELHGGRRAAGDARFLYDNECLCAAAAPAAAARAAPPATRTAYVRCTVATVPYGTPGGSTGSMAGGVSWAYGAKGHEDEQTAAGQRRQFDGKVAALKTLFADCAPPAVLQGTSTSSFYHVIVQSCRM